MFFMDEQRSQWYQLNSEVIQFVSDTNDSLFSIDINTHTFFCYSVNLLLGVMLER